VRVVFILDIWEYLMCFPVTCIMQMIAGTTQELKQKQSRKKKKINMILGLAIKEFNFHTLFFFQAVQIYHEMFNLCMKKQDHLIFQLQLDYLHESVLVHFASYLYLLVFF